MGYADLQDGRPPRNRAGAGLPDGPVPAEMPGEEAPGYRPPPVPGADEAARRGADEAAWRGADEAAWRGNGTTDRSAHAAPGNGSRRQGTLAARGTQRRDPAAAQRTPAAQGPALARGWQRPATGGPLPAARTGAHRAVRGTEPRPARPAAAGGHRSPAQWVWLAPQRGAAPAIQPCPARSGKHPVAGRARTGHGGTQPPGRPATGPQRPSAAARPARRGWPGQQNPVAATGRDRPSGPGVAVQPAAGRPGQRIAAAQPDRTATPGPAHGPPAACHPAGALPPPREPTDGPRRRDLPRTGPQAPYQARPDDPGDAPPGVAITREPPGARRSAPQQASSPRDGGRGGPIRGYPPRPGQPDPVYPPGQFSSWNRASTRAAWLGVTGGAGGAPRPRRSLGIRPSR